MNASEGVVGLKSTSFSTTGGAVFVAGTPFSPRQVGVGGRAQSSEYFAPVHRRSPLPPGGGAGSVPGPPSTPRQVGVGERAQSSEYFAPVHRRSTVSPGIGSGTGPRCPYATRSTTAPVSSPTRITPPPSGTGMSYPRPAHVGSPTTL